MFFNSTRQIVLTAAALFTALCFANAQKSTLKLHYTRSSVYAGIEVGSKGVKMSFVEIGKNAKKSGAFHILKDTSVNSDFISFSPSSFTATLNALTSFYELASRQYEIPAESIYTVVSSGVKMQAEKENRTAQINALIDSFKLRISDPAREVEVVDVIQEAKLSHLGIVPESRRYSTFLIDIGSGNTKGGFFPNGDTKTLKLFQLNWGTKSTTNATDSRLDDDRSLVNFNRQLGRVLSSAENSEIIYAVNESGAFPMSDYIAFSGGIAWSVSTLLHPELAGNSVIPVTYDEVLKFSEKLYRNFSAMSEDNILKSITDNTVDRVLVEREIKSVNKVFDQRSLMAGTGLLLKIMRQFESVNEKKQFFLVKNGQVGWISAYVDQQVRK